MNNNRIIPLAIALASVSLTLISGAVSAQSGGSSVKTPAAPADPLKNAVLIGFIESRRSRKSPIACSGDVGIRLDMR